MFINGADEKAVASILQTLSTAMSKNEGFRAFAYIEGKNADQLKALHKKLKLGNVALCIIPAKEKKDTMAGYKINAKAKSTVLVYKAREVSKTFTNYDPDKDKKGLEAAIALVCKE